MTDNRSPCIITKMCDADSTTCNDTSGEAVCDCKPGFVNNTYVNETNVLNPYYECYRACKYVFIIESFYYNMSGLNQL